MENRMNDLYQYHFEEKKWEWLWEYKDVDDFSPEKDRKLCPCPRSGQGIWHHNGSIYLFGGRNDYNDKLKDTWEFNISSKTWREIEWEETPVGRSSHTISYYDNKMILFGGIEEITKRN